MSNPSQFPSPAWQDANLVNASWVSAPAFQSPLPLDTTPYIFTQQWQGPVTTGAVAQNTPHPSANMVPDYSNYFLMSEGPREHLGGTEVRWTRTYARLPASYSLPEPFPYSFIGFYGSWGQNVLLPQGRNRNLLTVQSRVQYDFFMVDPNNVTSLVNDTNGPVYSSQNNIPVISAQKYRIVAPFGTSWWTDIDWLADAPPFNLATTPSRTTYNGYQANASALGWKSGVVVYNWGQSGSTPTVNTTGTQPNPGQICAEDSRVDLWLPQGSIFVRRTRFVLAQ